MYGYKALIRKYVTHCCLDSLYVCGRWLPREGKEDLSTGGKHRKGVPMLTDDGTSSGVSLKKTRYLVRRSLKYVVLVKSSAEAACAKLKAMSTLS
jgi:hypothetical protein